MNTFKSNLHSLELNPRIALIGTFPPTKCGIATFSADLAEAIRRAGPDSIIDIFTISTQFETKYPLNVQSILQKDCQADYLAAASQISAGDYDVVSIQHEYGIFGGIAGSFILDLIWNIETPIITTLHTVLDKPSLTQKLVLEAILNRSQRIVVMSHKAVQLLESVHGIPREKIDMIPHGTPVFPHFSNPQFRSDTPPNAPLLLTFGLLSPDKGIEFVISAMPEIIREFPGAKYAIVGVTHPHIVETAGEKYRDELIQLSKKIGVAESIEFVNDYVPLESIVGYLDAADFYITPYLNRSQITSGTLAYAVGAGKAVISTPYWYAEELLDDGRGVLVPFKDSKAISDAVISLQKNQSDKDRMETRAIEFGQSMSWENVGKSYHKSIWEVRNQVRNEAQPKIGKVGPPVNILPKLNTFHLKELTDDCGIIQHAQYSVPLRSEGYCVDDNARALLLTALLETQHLLPADVDMLQSRYLSFVLDAYNPDEQRFKNFMSYDRRWLESKGSEDSHGRTVWALGTLSKFSRKSGRKEIAWELLTKALPASELCTSPRTWAYSILGGESYLQMYPYDLDIRNAVFRLAKRLLKLYETSRTSDWLWFEGSLTYANARLPQALIVAGNELQNETMLNAGIESLDWLRLIQTDATGCFSPVGTNGYFGEIHTFEQFDQQPVEAASSVSAYLSAWRITGNSIWLAEAHRAFRWFTGSNTLGVPVCDPDTGACYDGIHADRLNLNQGAESTLSFLCALTELQTTIGSTSTKTLVETQ